MSIFFPEASGSSNLGSSRNDIYMPGPPVKNDQSMNDWLKKDLINRQNSDRNYKQMAVSTICSMGFKYRLSHEGPSVISFIARGMISYFVTRERSERGTKYDIVTRAIKLMLPSQSKLSRTCAVIRAIQGRKSDVIF